MEIIVKVNGVDVGTLECGFLKTKDGVQYSTITKFLTAFGKKNDKKQISFLYNGKTFGSEVISKSKIKKLLLTYFAIKNADSQSSSEINLKQEIETLKARNKVLEELLEGICKISEKYRDNEETSDDEDEEDGDEELKTMKKMMDPSKELEERKQRTLKEYLETQSEKPKEALPPQLTRDDYAKILSKKQMQGYDYYHANIKDILANYSGKWIGILEGKILFPSSSRIEIARKLDIDRLADVFICHPGVDDPIPEIL